MEMMQLLVMGGAIAAPLAMAAWRWHKTVSSSSKLATLLVIGMILRALQRVLGPARRRSTHWLIQYGAWAAFYLPIPLAIYALGIMSSSPRMSMRIVLGWGYVLIFFVMEHTESMTSYRLNDTQQHGWRHLQRLFYPVYWFSIVLTDYMDRQLSLRSLVFAMITPTITLFLMIFLFVKTPDQIIPLPKFAQSSLSEKLAEYMKCEAESGEPFFDHGEINLRNCRYPFENNLDGIWITMKDVFLLESVDRDICLSYTFFTMIKRRFYGFDCAEEDDQRVRRFVLRELLAGENSGFTNRAFEVVERQLYFLYDHLFTGSSSLAYTMKLFAGNGLFSLFFLIFQVPVLAYSYIKKWDSRHVILLLIMDQALRMLQFMYYLASDWYEVWYAFRCGTESRKRLHRPESRNILYRPSATERLAGWLRNTELFTRQHYWQNKIGQYSLLEDYDRVSAKKKLVVLATGFVLDQSNDFIRHHPLEKDPVSLPDSVKELVARTLRATNGRPTNGSTSLERYRERAQEGNPDRVPIDLSWTLTQKTHTHTILIWHIATCYCKMIGVEESSDFEVAKTLSGYCAYLVAFLPELLPEHSQTSTRVLQLVLKQAQRLLGKTGSMEEKRTKIQGLQLPEEEGRLTAFQKGVKLGRQLERLDTSLRWEVMAEFWAETMLYVAPSDNVKAHVEQLAKGGEFVTHVWALLSNAGILKRARQQRSVAVQVSLPVDGCRSVCRSASMIFLKLFHAPTVDGWRSLLAAGYCCPSSCSLC